jgi:hypothetical protein
MRLSRENYGDLEQIENLPVDKFMNLIHYENYLSKYKIVMEEMNRKK